ncbi:MULTISPECIES: hypothetical protein [Chitinophaga]|jgi:hypothetical protein|uniref:hypothetical protein n=1 Tax=Chitinophaga TaxID=79328 RepID=UPI000DB9FCF6|nr:hypothetical protein [Chitinophaga ginsengisegetis]MDR6570038.1 hypothetical protein [Chitinophaga ginsengisegetis]MDR6649772.1 hypothetical protein [Chitinophaga ginsengisegetis]MDR6656025.1 hypothetical protein [Chitinophaga ginsengisegetis]
MKKASGKKLSLGKIKVASLSNATGQQMAATVGTCSVLCSLRICTDNISQGAPICSLDSCRY